MRECITEVAVEEYSKKKLTETAKVKRSILPLIKEVLSELAPQGTMVYVLEKSKDPKNPVVGKRMEVPLPDPADPEDVAKFGQMFPNLLAFRVGDKGKYHLVDRENNKLEQHATADIGEILKAKFPSAAKMKREKSALAEKRNKR